MKTAFLSFVCVCFVVFFLFPHGCPPTFLLSFSPPCLFFPLCHLLLPLYYFPSFLRSCLSFSLSFPVSLLVVGGAALPLAGVVHARRADGAGDEVGGAGRHEVSHCRRDVHPLVCHQVICRAKTKTSIIQPNCVANPVGKKCVGCCHFVITVDR